MHPVSASATTATSFHDGGRSQECYVIFPFFPSDWLAATREMTLAERGAFIDLICMMHDADGPIPYDLKRVARCLGVPAGTASKQINSLIEQK